MRELLRLDWLTEPDVFALRRLGHEVAAAVGLEYQDQVRVATALSEVGREILSPEPTSVVFALLDHPARLAIRVTSRRRLPVEEPDGFRGVAAARRLVDGVSAAAADGRAVVLLEKRLPHRPLPTDVASRLRESLNRARTVTPVQELRAQNAELVRALDPLVKQRDELVRLNEELQQTNRGVLAMYTELAGELEETNRGVVALYAELDEKSGQLVHANEAKTRFLRNVSHELRSPVNSIIGLTQLLSDGPLDDEQRRQVDYVQSSARSLLRLVNELLDLARAESDRLAVSRADAQLAPLFNDLRGSLRPVAADRGIALVVDEPDVAVIFTDADLLARVLRNLLANALSFTEAGQVRLRAVRRESGQHVEISISDTGIGIAPEHQERVFEEFFQVPGPLQAHRSGTGLGLPYARRVTEALGGVLSLTSAPGVGSTFTVMLPIGTGGAIEDRPVLGEEQVVAGTLGHVLVVEDDEPFRHLLRGMLQGAAERVSEAAGGAEALALAREGRPDLVLLDLRLPDLDGAAVLARLRADSDAAGRGLPVVLMTSAAVDAQVRRTAQAAAGLLAKSDLTRASLLRLLTTIAAGRPT